MRCHERQQPATAILPAHRSACVSAPQECFRIALLPPTSAQPFTTSTGHRRHSPFNGPLMLASQAQHHLPIERYRGWSLNSSLVPSLPSRCHIANQRSPTPHAFITPCRWCFEGAASGRVLPRAQHITPLRGTNRPSCGRSSTAFGRSRARSGSQRAVSSSVGQVCCASLGIALSLEKRVCASGGCRLCRHVSNRQSPASATPTLRSSGRYSSRSNLPASARSAV